MKVYLFVFQRNSTEFKISRSMIEQQLFSELDFTKENCMKHYKIKVACIHCVWTFACAIHWNSPAGSVCDLYSLTSGIYFYQLNAHTLTKWQKSFVQQYKFKQIKENVKIESQQIYGTFQINVIVEQHIKNGQFELLLNKQMLCLSKCWDCSQLTWTVQVWPPHIVLIANVSSRSWWDS